MNNKVNIYSTRFTIQTVPGAISNIPFDLVCSNRRFKLLNIYFDVIFFSGLMPPYTFFNHTTNTTQRYWLRIGTAAVPMIGKTFENFGGGAIVGMNGTAVDFLSPGRYELDGYFVFDTLPFNYYQRNDDVLNTVTADVNVITQINEIE